MNATDCEHGARCNNPKENAKIVFEKRNGAIIFGASGIQSTAHANGLAKRLLAAYTGHESDLENPVKTNAAIIDNGLTAVKHLCPNLEIVSLQTGGKGYGILGFGWPPAPWKEDLARLPEPYASKIF
ncbi:SirQ [Colletotrichum cuscutae]|uniref:SirQ n=1 Tax=Colletotrichum cuscutae TaxID=1209917 RepID=A0AAI9Y1H9_9PEZI|nr:SirQ [Colletotrichum cuscutae]